MSSPFLISVLHFVFQPLNKKVEREKPTKIQNEKNKNDRRLAPTPTHRVNTDTEPDCNTYSSVSLFFLKLKQNAGHDLKDSALAFNGAAAAAAAAAGWPYPSMYYPYDPSLAAYPFGG